MLHKQIQIQIQPSKHCWLYLMLLTILLKYSYATQPSSDVFGINITRHISILKRFIGGVDIIWFFGVASFLPEQALWSCDTHQTTFSRWDQCRTDELKSNNGPPSNICTWNEFYELKIWGKKNRMTEFFTISSSKKTYSKTKVQVRKKCSKTQKDMHTHTLTNEEC